MKVLNYLSGILKGLSKEEEMKIWWWPEMQMILRELSSSNDWFIS